MLRVTVTLGGYNLLLHLTVNFTVIYRGYTWRLHVAVTLTVTINRYILSVNKVRAVRLREAKGRLSYKRGGEELLCVL
jgi:hypothetical protein